MHSVIKSSAVATFLIATSITNAHAQYYNDYQQQLRQQQQQIEEMQNQLRNIQSTPPSYPSPYQQTNRVPPMFWSPTQQQQPRNCTIFGCY